MDTSEDTSVLFLNNLVLGFYSMYFVKLLSYYFIKEGILLISFAYFFYCRLKLIGLN